MRPARLSRARLAVLDVLASQPEPCSVASVARALDQHTNTVREHLEGLVEAGLATSENAPAHGRGRPARLYTPATESPTTAGAAEYAGLASALAAQIARSSADPVGDALAAGRAWGSDLAETAETAETAAGPHGAGGATPPPDDVASAARHDVVSLLDRLGFAPRADDDAASVALTRCPLLEAAYRNPEVVCAVHLGLAQGALERLGAPSEGTSLLPFAEPGACRLHLRPQPAPGSRDRAS
ncbi:ArsR family transcriptional regulator [Oerskovia turbata]|uniref:ArsR family transcriptional regulator n=1 Tax=Oerskovia turbata TaxID=1713 RepID=A0A4Q1L2N0_9CELL|nr:ArsR family transcriptional regulator [Oerskovia turbata]RXR36567.1 ArsR family transcriptional regulator [Oerskovia turbata]